MTEPIQALQLRCDGCNSFFVHFEETCPFLFLPDDDLSEVLAECDWSLVDGTGDRYEAYCDVCNGTAALEEVNEILQS